MQTFTRTTYIKIRNLVILLLLLAIVAAVVLFYVKREESAERVYGGTFVIDLPYDKE